MTSGKTTVGQLVAGRLGWNFRDLDQLVTVAAGRTIPQIFAEEGELGFRARETEGLRQAVLWNNTVISTGGGAACREPNLSLMLDAGRVVQLDVSPEEVIRRAGDLAHRPLLATAPDPLKFVKDLLATRAPFYARAHFRIATDGLTPEAVAAEVLQVLEAKPA